MLMDTLRAISPIDGRYHSRVEELQHYFSEMALMRYRLVVEVEYFIALSLEKGIPQFPALSKTNQDRIRAIYRNFTPKDAAEIKKIEKTTNHDVKAIEYFFKKQLKAKKLDDHAEFVHFALTSEDVNNLSYSMMWADAVSEVYRPLVLEVHQALFSFAKKYKAQPMLALTHGQSATPTTIGKEFAVVASRVKRQLDQLTNHKLQGKFGGATGTWAAHAIAYPKVNWLAFSKKFISQFGLEPNLLTIQIEPHDSLAESYHLVSRINTVLLDFSRDVWSYISRGILGQKKKAGEVGSSTMPHKINPIQFENAEGNFGIANAYLSHLAQKLPISRMQRDLSDSTVLRNQGMPLAHAVLALKNILSGMGRITVNKQKLNHELDHHWEVLAEAIQTVLRKYGYKKPYEKVKELTRGKKIGQKEIQAFITSLRIPEEEKQLLLNLTPQTYTGLAEKLVR